MGGGSSKLFISDFGYRVDNTKFRVVSASDCIALEILEIRKLEYDVSFLVSLSYNISPNLKF